MRWALLEMGSPFCVMLSGLLGCSLSSHEVPGGPLVCGGSTALTCVSLLCSTSGTGIFSLLRRNTKQESVPHVSSQSLDTHLGLNCTEGRRTWVYTFLSNLSSTPGSLFQSQLLVSVIDPRQKMSSLLPRPHLPGLAVFSQESCQASPPIPSHCSGMQPPPRSSCWTEVGNWTDKALGEPGCPREPPGLLWARRPAPARAAAAPSCPHAGQRATVLPVPTRAAVRLSWTGGGYMPLS